jgi:hypothetical protein
MLLYFVKAGDAIKVGVATDIKKRIGGMQTGSQHRIKLLHCIDLPSEKARLMEKEIHIFFQKTNLHGEWFRFTQFMFDYIENIKDNGLESHEGWLQKRYLEEYDEIVTALKIKIERDIAYGDFVSLEKLKIEINEVFEEITLRQSKPDNVADTVKEWIEKRGKSFTPRDIYNYFGFSARHEKKNVCMILSRCEKAGMVERIDGMRRGVYRKITHED